MDPKLNLDVRLRHRTICGLPLVSVDAYGSGLRGFLCVELWDPLATANLYELVVSYLPVALKI